MLVTRHERARARPTTSTCRFLRNDAARDFIRRRGAAVVHSPLADSLRGRGQKRVRRYGTVISSKSPGPIYTELGFVLRKAREERGEVRS